MGISHLRVDVSCVSGLSKLTLGEMQGGEVTSSVPSVYRLSLARLTVSIVALFLLPRTKSSDTKSIYPSIYHSQPNCSDKKILSFALNSMPPLYGASTQARPYPASPSLPIANPAPPKTNVNQTPSPPPQRHPRRNPPQTHASHSSPTQNLTQTSQRHYWPLPTPAPHHARPPD